MLKKRLQLIHDIFDNEVSVDIGADHGFLTIALLQSNKTSSAEIVEVNQGPYDNSLLNVKKNGYENNVKLHLGDGLKPFNESFESNYGIIVAGMGGKLIADILFNNPSVLGEATLYLQPNNSERYLRQQLIKHGFKIISDLLVDDMGIIYTVLVAKKGTQTLNEVELSYGFDIDYSDTLFIKRYNEELAYLNKTITNIPDSSEKYQEFSERIKMLELILGAK